MKQEGRQYGYRSPPRAAGRAGPARLSFGQVFSLGQILSLASEAIVCVDSYQRVAFFNEAASNVLGWSCAEAVGMPLDMLLPQRYRKERAWERPNAFTAPSAIRVISENRLRMSFLRKNGEEFPAEASIGRVGLGGATFLVFVVRDASNSRRAEEALRLGAERLRVLVKHAPIMIAHQDRQLRYTWMHWPNAPFPLEQVIGSTDAGLFAPEEAHSLTEIKERVLHTAEGARAQVRITIDGTARLHDLAVEPLLSVEGRIAGITCVSWDVTAQKRAEHMHELAAKIGTALSETPDHEQALASFAQIVAADLADCCILELIVEGRTRRVRAAHRERGKAGWTDEIERLRLENGRGLGWGALESRKPVLLADVTEPYLQSVAQDETHLRLLRELAPKSLVAVPLVARKQLLGAMVLVASNAARAFGNDDLLEAGEIARWAALVAENAQLQRTARSAVEDRDETLGIVAHDLRSPLAVIENCAQAIALRLRQSGAAGAGPASRSPDPLIQDLRQGNSTSVEQILRSSGDATRLIHDLLDTSQKNGRHFPIERRRVRLEKLAAEVIETQKFAAGSHPLSLQLEGGASLPKAWCDRRRIGQVLQNLLDNAAKFSPQDAPITVYISSREGELLVSVSDRGRGIPPKDLEQVFERFWHGAKGRHAGTGLGLSICKEIVEAHGGRIWADSTVGVGSNFFFTVPAAPARPLPAGPADREPDPGPDQSKA